MLGSLLKRRQEDIHNRSRITHPMVWFMVALLGTSALYGLYVKWATPGFQGKWHISGRCIQPRYDWLGGCLVGMDLAGGGPAFFYVAEKGQNTLYQYEGKVRRSEKNPQELILRMPLNTTVSWAWKMDQENLLIQFSPQGPWVPFSKGSANPKDGNFNSSPESVGVEPSKPKVDPFEKKQAEEKLEKMSDQLKNSSQ